VLLAEVMAEEVMVEEAKAAKRDAKSAPAVATADGV